MKITNQKLINKALDIRMRMLKKARDSIKQDYQKQGKSIDDESLYCRSVSKVGNKHYDELREEMKKNHEIDYVIINSGGDQNNKIKELEKEGKKYIHLSEDLISAEKDKKSFFK